MQIILITLLVSPLGYEKCFVYLFWFKMEQTLLGFGVTRFTSAFASASFSARFPEEFCYLAETIS